MDLDSSALVVSTRKDPIRLRDMDARRLLRIAHGYYLPEDAIPRESAPWQVRKLVTQARMLATAYRFSGENPALFTAEAALLLQGVQTWLNVPDLSFWRQTPTRRPKTSLLPAVLTRGVLTPSVRAQELRGQRIPLGSEVVSGVPTVSLPEAALDIARFGHPLPAWVGATGAIRTLSGFDRFDLKASRNREQAVKRELLQHLDPPAGTPGSRRTPAILSKVDAGAESPGEAVYCWLLNIILRGDLRPIAHFHSQHRVVARGKTYYLDVGFPELHVGGEFDGVGKVTESYRQGRAWIERQYALQSVGWRLLRFATPDLEDIPGLALNLAAELEDLGLRVQGPGGLLWKEIPPRLVSAGRRH